MKKNFFVTGLPGTGKTTLIRKVKLPAHRAGLPGRERTKHECAP